MSPELRPTNAPHYVFVDPPKRRGFWKVFGGIWLNRKYTSLTSSIMLGAALTIAFCAFPYIVVEDAQFSFANLFTEYRLIVWFALANFLFYPFSREIYFRLTQPIRVAIGGIVVWGWVVLILWVVRLAIFLYLWLLAIPLGIIGVVYLAAQEALGKGWRVQE